MGETSNREPEIRSTGISEAIKTPFLTMLKELFVTSSGKTGEWYYLDHPVGGVHVVGLDKARKNFILVEQYRFPIKKYSLEIIGGGIDNDENPEDAARREFLEEAGYEGDKLVSLGESAINVAYSNGMVFEYLLLDCVPSDKYKHVQHEEVQEVKPVLIPVDSVRKMVVDGKFISSHSVSALLKALLYLER